jgi:hypothetical protein
MRRILDYKDDERIGDWASRTCQLIMHDGDGVADLTELPRQVDFNKNGDPPVVDFQLPYRNTGKSPISVVMQVMTLAVPRASPEDADSWQKVDALTYRFDLAPGQQYTLTGRLLWVANADAYPRLLFPLSKNSLYSAIRGESLSNYPESRNLTSTLPPRLSRLAANLMMIANAASDQFKSVRGQPCRNTQGNKVCPLTVSIPSSELAEITYEANGATSVEIILYDGKSANAAGKVYADFKKDLETIDPSKSYRERTTSSGGKSMSFVPTSTSAFELRLTKLSNGVFYVTATIVPAAYSD